MKKKEGNEKEKTRGPSSFSSVLVQGVRHPKLLHF
jgi:hypothetical protein